MATGNRQHTVLPDDARPCVWMSAGLIAYRLCDREFDCDACPLDAALRGVAPPPRVRESFPVHTARAADFPDDRRYSTGHLWVQQSTRTGQNRFRLGLDGFAADLMGDCLEVRCGRIPRRLSRRSLLFEIELKQGALPLSAPFDCRVVRPNRLLTTDPQRVGADPYGQGWIAEVVPTEAHGTEGLLTAAAARKQAHMDLRGFRRRAAIHLLTDAADLGVCLADGGAVLTDLRQMLGNERYLHLIRELIA